MADRLAVMRDGHFAQIGDPATLYDQPVDAWVALFLGSANRIRATVGEGDALASDLGALAVGHVATDLAAGDPALVVVRPEQTRFSRAGVAGTNAIPARIADVVALGASLRLRAITAGGVEFESIEPRDAMSEGGAAFHTGDSVLVTFEPSAARAYRAGSEPLPLHPSS